MNRSYALLAAAAAINVAAYVIGEPRGADWTRIEKPAGLVSIVLVVVVAWMSRRAAAANPAAAGSDSDRLARLTRLLAVAVLFAFAGDVLLSGILGGAVLPAMIVFGIAYSTYSYAFYRDAGSIRPVVVAGWALFAIASWYLIVVQGSAPPLMAGLGLFYALVLASLPAFGRGTFQVAGAIILVSDLIISMRLFNRPQFEMLPLAIRGDIVWITYALGQLLVHGAAARRVKNS